MCELTTHEEYVKAHPREKAAALALVDHHQERFGVCRLVALKVVATMRRQSIAARELQDAATLLASGSQARVQLTRAIRIRSGLRPLYRATVVLVEGRQPARVHARESRALGSYFPGTVTVGARSVLRLARELGWEVVAGRVQWMPGSLHKWLG